MWLYGRHAVLAALAIPFFVLVERRLFKAPVPAEAYSGRTSGTTPTTT